MSIQYNAPVILSYTLLCVGILVLHYATGGWLMSFFTVYPRMDFFNPIDYFRLFSHALGHGDFAHLIGNFTLILLLGPILEEKYGSKTILLMMFLTALITGILNVALFTSGLLGASGIVFMLILLSSLTNLKQGKIPLTFIFVLVLFVGQEVLKIFENNSVSEFAHIIGGVCGAFFGFQTPKKT